MPQPAGPPTGRIFDIQRFSIHDGPGIRTTVFFKGCPLRCLWCHNPEAVAHDAHLSYVAARCIGCGCCVSVCPHGAHRLDTELGHVLTRDACTACGLCAAECRGEALELVGRDASVAEVLGEVLRDRPFYDSSGGGMTLSGGEPLAQPEFALALLRGARAAGLHCAVETCGAVPWDRFEAVLPLVDLFLFDLKESDAVLHRQFTGASNTLIVDNLRRLHERGASLVARLPLVPGVNDRDEHFEAVAALLNGLPRLLGVEIMAYHALGEGKRARLGLPASALATVEEPDAATVAGWAAALRARGVMVRGAA
jgi:pyruvate formate lyase activating enzyme